MNKITIGLFLAVASVCFANPGGEPPKKECMEYWQSKCPQRSKECFEQNVAQAPEGCRRPHHPPPFIQELEKACGKTAMESCKSKGPGPGALDCLASQGSEECKTKVTEIKSKRHGKRPE